MKEKTRSQEGEFLGKDGDVLGLEEGNGWLSRGFEGIQ